MSSIVGNASEVGASFGILNHPVSYPLDFEYFLDGAAFSYEDYHIFAAGETKTFMFDTSSFTGSFLFIRAFHIAAVSGPILTQIYKESQSNDDGASLYIHNQRLSYPGPATVLRLNPTGVVLGQRVIGDLTPATGVTPATASPGCSIPSLPFEPTLGGKAAIKMTNNDGANCYVGMKIVWFEVA